MQLKQTIETELEIQKNSKTLCLNKIIECLKNNKDFLEWKSKTEPFIKQEINERNIISMVLYWSGKMDVKNPYYWISGYFYNIETNKEVIIAIENKKI